MMLAEETSQQKGKAAMADDPDHSLAQAGEMISRPLPSANSRREWHRPVITRIKVDSTLSNTGSHSDGAAHTAY
jgi:hypothetical protein